MIRNIDIYYNRYMASGLTRLALVTIFIACMPGTAQAGSLASLLGQQRILGEFDGWMVSSGKAVDESSYCSMDATARNGLMSFRTTSASPNLYEWHVSPHAAEAPATRTITAIAYVADPNPIPVPFAVIRLGATADLQNKYWFMAETEDLPTLSSIARRASPEDEIQVTFPNTAYPTVAARVGGFREATSAYMACIRLMP
jgi:hypothetical protein